MSVLRQLLIDKALNSNKNPLTFTATQDNSSVKLTKSGSPNSINLLYKLNDNQWTDYTINTVISLNNNDKVSFKGTTNIFSKNNNNYYNFVMTGKIKASGNTNSLINYDQLTQYCYYQMFYNCSSLISISQNLLPATTLANYCYERMFYECAGLTSISQNLLPATTLANACYSNMFYGCSKLSNITVNFTDWNSSNNSTTSWLYEVSSTGTFTCPSSLPKTRGDSYIPQNWIIVTK